MRRHGRVVGRRVPLDLRQVQVVHAAGRVAPETPEAADSVQASGVRAVAPGRRVLRHRYRAGTCK